MTDTAKSPTRSGMSLDELSGARSALFDEGRKDAVERQHQRGKMTARERIAYLLDEDSFVEYGAFATPDESERMRGIDAPAEGLVAGTGKIAGRPVSLFAIDFTVLGGSNGNAGVAKIARMARLSLQHGYPHIMLLDGGGHRMQEMDSREWAAAGPSAFQEQALMSGWTPQVGAIMGPAFAGPAAQAMFADFVPIVKGSGAIGVAGTALVRAATSHAITTQELAGSRVQARNGVVDLEVEDDRACLDTIKTFLAYFPSNAGLPPPQADSKDPADRLTPELRDVLPESRRRAYDIRTVLKPVVDDACLFELKSGYAQSVITTLARIGGRPVGIIANQPKHRAGTLDAPACIKISRFASMCDAYGLPLVTFIDSPGMLIGPPAESQTLIRYATKVLMVFAHTTVPIISVVIRKAYGLAYLALAGGRSFDADACFIWPSAEVCPMSIEGAIDQIYKRDVENAEDPQARRAELLEQHYARTTPLRAASGFGIDDIIDPAETRKKIAMVLSTNQQRRSLSLPPKRHSVEPF